MLGRKGDIRIEDSNLREVRNSPQTITGKVERRITGMSEQSELDSTPKTISFRTNKTLSDAVELELVNKLNSYRIDWKNEQAISRTNRKNGLKV